MTPYERARAAFDTYATMGAPQLPGDAMSAVQVQLYRWQVRNFDLQPAARFVLGIVEEVGEMGEAVEHDDRDAILDAIGDACIYATQLATTQRLDFGALLWASQELAHSQPVDVALGRIAHAVLKTEQRIRGFDDPEKGRFEVANALLQLLHRLRTIARYMQSELPDVYLDTAEQVLKRDWVADPMTGAA